MGVTVTIRDNVDDWRALMRRSKSIDGYQLQVGYPLGAKIKKGTRKGSGRKPWLSMEELAYIAFVHEFGSEKRNIPARETLKPAYEKNEAEIINLLAVAAEETLHGVRRIDHSLRVVGRFIVSKIREEIDSLPRDLAESTVKKKGSDTPLIDTKQMYNSVGFVVTRE